MVHQSHGAGQIQPVVHAQGSQQPQVLHNDCPQLGVWPLWVIRCIQLAGTNRVVVKQQRHLPHHLPDSSSKSSMTSEQLKFIPAASRHVVARYRTMNMTMPH